MKIRENPIENFFLNMAEKRILRAAVDFLKKYFTIFIDSDRARRALSDHI